MCEPLFEYHDVIKNYVFLIEFRHIAPSGTSHTSRQIFAIIEMHIEIQDQKSTAPSN